MFIHFTAPACTTSDSHVPWSRKKRCALEEEQVKRIKCEEEVQAVCKDVKEQAAKLGVLIDLVGNLAQQKGVDDKSPSSNENNGEPRVYEEDESENEDGYEDTYGMI